VRFFYRAFELPSPRNAQKRDKQKSRKIGFGFFVDFLKNLSTRFFGKTFSVVFLNSHHEETPKNAMKQKKSRKT
jgi:hypothetical protein